MKIKEIMAHLSKFRAGIAGAGGLGSNCAVALARAGIGSLVIADYDIVEKANLSRQYYFISHVGMNKTDALKSIIAEINPDVSVTAHNIRIDRHNIKPLFSGCDIIIEAFDDPGMKEMLAETVQAEMPGIPLIIGSGMAGWGRNEIIRCRKIDETLYVCGDEETETSEELPPLAPRVGIVANMQANTAIGVLMDINR